VNDENNCEKGNKGNSEACPPKYQKISSVHKVQKSLKYIDTQLCTTQYYSVYAKRFVHSVTQVCGLTGLMYSGQSVEG